MFATTAAAMDSANLLVNDFSLVHCSIDSACQNYYSCSSGLAMRRIPDSSETVDCFDQTSEEETGHLEVACHHSFAIQALADCPGSSYCCSVSHMDPE